MRQIQSKLRYFCMRLMYSRSEGNLTDNSSPRCAPCWILTELCYRPRPTKDDVILPLGSFYDINSRATIAGPSQQNRIEKVNLEGSEAIRMTVSQTIQRGLLKAKEELKTKEDDSNPEIIALKNKLQVKKQMWGKGLRIKSLPMNGVRRLA
ncbi:hypothetical protein TNCV_2827831 [Trichonephila clavipes]|nr:hypothetical protein TNCV_2827831 [Trichonephila clavipes]